MAESTNVGSVAFSIEIDNRNQIRQVVREVLGDAQRQANSASQSIVRSTNAASNGFASMAKSIGLVTVAFVGLRKAFNFGRESIALASDLQEVQNVVDTTFGSMSSQVNTFAKNAMNTVGLSEKVAKQYMGSFGAMSKAFGFTTKDAYAMSESLTTLAGDVSSFYNLSSDEAYTKLKSVFTGETEALKDLGVVMTQAALDSFALEQGFGKTTKAMSEQEKTLLRYEFVMNRLSLAQGDFIRTQDGWANQTRVLKLRFDELKATIGEGLIIALTPVVKMLNLIIGKLTVAAQAFTGFIKNLFGIKESEGGTNQLVDDMSNAGAAATGMASGTAQTAKNLAKAKRQLMGFDKLYKLADTSSTTSDESGAGGLVGLGSVGGAGSTAISPEMTLPSASELGKKISDFVVTMFNTIKEKLNSVDWNGIGQKVGEFMHAIDWVSIFLGLGEVIYAALNAAAKMWKGAFDAAPLETAIITGIALLKFTPLGAILGGLLTKAIGGGVKTAIGGIKGFVSKIVEAFALALGGAGTLKEAFVALFGGVGATIAGIGTVVAGAITAVWNFVDMVVNGFSWVKEILMVVGIAITAVGAIILGAPAVVAGVVAAIVAAIGTAVVLIKEHWESISAFFANAWVAVKNWLSTAYTTVVTTITNVYNKVMNWGANMVNGAKNIMTSIGNGLKSAWGSVQSWFSGKLNEFKNAFTNTFTNIKNGVVNIFNSISNAIKAPINAVIRMLNNMIDGLNRIKVDIPDWVPGSMGGKSLGFSIPRIPMLAMGGYVKPNNPQLAIIGDNRREGEIVAPESKITEAVNNALIPFINQLVGALRGPQTAMAGTGDIVIPVYIGNDMIDQYIVNATTKNTFRSGR